MAMLPPDPVFIFKGDMESIMCLAYYLTDNTEYLFVGTVSGAVHIWNLKTNRAADKLNASMMSCLFLHVIDECNVIVQDKGGNIKFWSKAEDWSCVETLTSDYCGFCQCVVSDDVLLVPFSKSIVKTISMVTKESLGQLKCVGETLGEIMVVRTVVLGGKKLAWVCYENGTLVLFSLTNGEKVTDTQFEDCPMAFDFDAVSKRGILGGASENVVVLSLDESMVVRVKKNIRLTNPGVASVVIRPDRRVVALGCWDGKVRLYSWKNLIVLAVLDIHAVTVQALSYSTSTVTQWECKHLLAAGSKDGRVSMWNLYN